LDEALGALAGESSGRQAPARVEAALRSEFRRRRVRRRTPWFAVAAAALVLLAVLLAALRPARSPVAYRPITTGFLPVAYSQPFRLEDGGRIVRVRMPRSTLASFGLPVNQERLGERIQADVLLGEDNLVRAIRFEQ
jgi:hypothetical protein